MRFRQLLVLVAATAAFFGVGSLPASANHGCTGPAPCHNVIIVGAPLPSDPTTLCNTAPGMDPFSFTDAYAGGWVCYNKPANAHNARPDPLIQNMTEPLEPGGWLSYVDLGSRVLVHAKPGLVIKIISWGWFIPPS